ncbi:malonate decarboxylase subunit delta [Saccharibacillus sp. CPCC 101409]|uniref:malonate decarboxylase subunit delta n=1 Tax=Saccharibacillus sp. CPCC 101409 TaxID=3058041 RepID=UPI002672EDEF|nr:malonate decarboxylase subunit delta [Saccharibacillus sp. CPCC 101409]MDO3410406.1 malonate decarboxylase subunit delta [Saccharibacillus sp. CPCC 101409]
METIMYEYAAERSLTNSAHIGVAASGDLELLLEPSENRSASVKIRTTANGFEDIWKAVFDRFFARYPIAVKLEINDFGATPGVVNLRLAQAMEVLEHDN